MRISLVLLPCLVVAALSSVVAKADSAAAQMQVSVRVLPHARLEPVTPTHATIVVTSADVARGFIDVMQRYRLRTNAPEHVRLQFHPRAGYAQAITMEALGTTVQLHDGGVEMTPGRGGDVAFELRVWLVPGFAPGEYPVPVQVVAVVD